MSAAEPPQGANSAPRGAAQRRQPQAWGDHIALAIASVHTRFALLRRVQAEALDTLDPRDVRAVRARGDLRRINYVMATLRIVLMALDRVAAAPPRSIVELGAGDGSLMLRIARRRAKRWPGMHVVLVDRQPVVSPHNLAALRALGWSPEVVVADVFDWLARTNDARCDIVLANLFVHHFTAERITALLGAIADRSNAFICCEPRRDRVSLAASHSVRMIGASAVTRHDAVASVHAGFRGAEIGALWPQRGWRIDEYRAGLFSHCFVAARSSRS